MGHVREGIHFQSRIVVINFTALECAKHAPGENTLEVVFKIHIDFSFENGGNLIRNGGAPAAGGPAAAGSFLVGLVVWGR